ncbi:tetratricopeptide repeat protein [Rhodopirellula sp. JC639]|uniref:tetratricopeptide repeat protein n=1 Tax=Stieleria mannarensis TaxID=2755585 RepID=UPI0015FEF5A6|nr:tetratricopeptide repeat protein [Rhodopirellula sp. JC639]
MFTVSCQCGQQVQVRPSKAGTTMQCQCCGGRFNVPSLGEMKRRQQRNETIVGQQVGPAKSARDAQLSEIPSSFYVHLCGEVGSTARISTTAIENYSGVVAHAVDTLIAQADTDDGFELMVSLALLPGATRLMQIETAPNVPGDGPTCGREGLVDQITRRIESLALPDVEHGPVAFLMYRRVNLDPVTKLGIKPFSRYRSEIETCGIDDALMRAAGLIEPASDRTNPLMKWWNQGVSRLRAFVSKPAAKEDPTPTPQQVFQETSAWIESTEERYAGTSDAELQRLLRQSPSELTLHVASAARFANREEFENAIQAYSDAIQLAPQCAPLLGRRGWYHYVAGNHQAALIDLNRAIQLVPSAAWFYLHRSQIYSGLEAWEQAESDLGTAIGLAPREPAFRFRRAELHLGRDQLAPALDDLLPILRLDPHNGATHAMLGWLYQQDELHDESLAMEHLTRAIELVPDAIAPRLHRSMLYLSQNKFELARVDCDNALGLQQDEGQAHALRGRILQMQGEFDEAIRSCDRAIELGVETPAVFLTRGFCYAATEQRDLALADCHAVLDLDPKNPIALHLLGSLSLQQGELDAAMEALTEASRLAPQWTEPREQIALLHRMNENPQAAIDEQSALIEQQPAQPAHYVNRAFAHTQAGNHDDALNDYQRACELDPENEHIFFLRGCFLMDRQEDELALEDFNRALELSGVYDGARLRRAAVLMRLKRHDQALEDYEKLIEKYPDDPYAYSGRAYAHQMQGDESAAEADIDRLAEIAPEDAQEAALQSLQAKVIRLEGLERYDDAIAVAEEIIEMDPDAAVGYRLRGWIRWYSEQHVEAVDDYTRLLELSSEDPDPELLSSRGQIYAEMGEWDNALADLDAAVRLSRTAGLHQLLAFALNGRAFALAGLERTSESERDFEESIRLCPGNAWARYNRGIVFYKHGQHDQAKTMLLQALQLDGPPLTKRKRQRAEAVLERLATSQS